MKKQLFSGRMIDLVVFACAMAGTYVAQLGDRPITAVLVFLSGVILIAFRSGLLAGLAAALAASLTYNFFLSEPVYRFGITSAHEAVPLVAFNVAAIAAAALVGRLKDSVRTAQVAQSETAFLLAISDRLQSAVKLEEVDAAIRGILPRQGIKAIEILLVRDRAYHNISNGETELDPIRPLLAIDEAALSARQMDTAIYELPGARGALGLVRFELGGEREDRPSQTHLHSITAMLGIALERCLLLDELAEARALVRSEALKDAILSSVSHDLRTPVTVIQAAAGALELSDVAMPGEERKRLIASILEQCRRLDRYTSELVDVGRIEAGIAAGALQLVSPVEVLQSAIRQVRSAHPDIRFVREWSPSQQCVRANPVMLEQAVVNVLDNAAKFGGEAGPIRVSLAHEGSEVVIGIADQGPGIFEQDRAKVFTRFFKGNTQVGRSGLGLGLFITKGFLEAFGGAIAVESPLSEGRGARFELRLPLVAAHTTGVAA